MKKKTYAIMVSALVALILAVASGPAHATVNLLNEQFSTPSADVTTDTVNYPNYTFSGLQSGAITETVPVDNLQFKRISGSGVWVPDINAPSAIVVAGASSTLSVDFKITGGAALSDSALLRITNIDFNLFPGYDQITGGGHGGNLTGLTFAFGDLMNVLLTSDGFGHFVLTETNITAGGTPAVLPFTNLGVTSYSSTLGVSMGTATAIGIFDNWTLDETLPIPEPSVVLLFGLGGFVLWLRRRNR